ncbi:MAG: flagellar protein FliS [Phycisphaerales bacterium]
MTPADVPTAEEEVCCSMSQKPVNPYLKTKIMTASPEELRLTSHDALKFAGRPRPRWKRRISRTATTTLCVPRRSCWSCPPASTTTPTPSSANALAALYTYVYRLLVDANMSYETAIIDEAIKLIEYERETWQMLMKKLARGQAQRKPRSPPPSRPPSAASRRAPDCLGLFGRQSQSHISVCNQLHDTSMTVNQPGSFSAGPVNTLRHHGPQVGLFTKFFDQIPQRAMHRAR